VLCDSRERMIRAFILLTSAWVLFAAGDASAGPPTDQVRGSVDRVLKILSDAELKKEAKTGERREMIRTVANEIFDFTEISQRSLARHWTGRTPAERQEFVLLFGDLLEHSYITKIETYSGEKIQYAGEVPDGDQAVVKTRIVTKQGIEIPVDYRMFLKADRWRAYDVNIEGVSLVSNYRTQFNAVIQRAGYPDLVTKLKAKQAERPGPREAGRPEAVTAPPTPAPRPGLQTP
jgi:phospholipid transport system substrate-binding protein